ncbi:MAG TPA: hypothetical protein VMP67_06215 [Candidatus Limnocylindria bacterium]|nr:hypothetical protein [Candidatus Limnocylindria bacterium]
MAASLSDSTDDGRLRRRAERCAAFAALEQELVLRDDGRYLIYFSLPGAESDDSPPDGAPGGPPAQQPKAPDREPDV